MTIIVDVLLGCPITLRLQTHWHQQFVCEHEPIFVSAVLQQALPPEWPLLARADLHALILHRSVMDSYATFRVAAAETLVTAISPTSFRSLQPSLQQMILATQHTLGRGQIYEWAMVQPFLPVNIPTQLVACRRFQVDSQALLALDQAIWRALDLHQQWQWLRWFVQEQANPYQVVRDWLPNRSPIRSMMANTFCANSGPNCFATTLAAITTDRSVAETISTLWLPAQAFEAGLHQRGYVVSPEHDGNEPDLSDAVIVWYDATATPQHACYVIEQGIALNKDSQCWYGPRQLVAAQEVIAAWAEDGYQRVVYRRV